MKTKRIISFTLACLLSAGSMSFADYSVLHREYRSEPIGSGLSYQEDLLFTDQGWFPVRIIEGDLSEPGAALHLMTGEQVNARQSLSNLAVEEPLVIGAVNGDFFDTGLSTAMGPVIKDGNLLSSSIGDNRFNVVWTDADGRLQIGGLFEETYTLENLSSRYKMPVAYINKPYLEFDRLIVYDRAWEGFPPQRENALYMGVSDGRVAAFESLAANLDPSAYEFIVAASGAMVPKLQESFKEKQRIRLTVETDPDLSQLTDVFGGGSLLVKDGKIPESFSLPISGRHPRTALGTDAEGARFWLVTVDGRSSSAAGMTEMELALYMKNLGAYNAINLDGGDSTEMLVRRLGEDALSPANTPSGGASRRIAGGISVTASESSGAPWDFRLDVSDRRVLLGTSRKLETLFYDQAFNPAWPDSASIQWTVDGPGRVVDGRFYPEARGDVLVTGTYKEHSHSVSLTGCDELVSLRLYPRSLSLDLGESAVLSALARTAEGYDISVDFEDLDLNLPERLGVLHDNRFEAGDRAASGKLSVSIANFWDEIPVSIGYSSYIFKNFDVAGGAFLAYPEAVTGDYALDGDFKKNGKSSGRLTYDFSATDATRAAYLELEHELYAAPARLGLWVKGDEGGGHWLRASLTDAAGKTQTIDFARYVDWKGWQFVDAAIPSNVAFPVTLNRLYLVETDSANKTSGRIWFDDFTAFYKTPYSGPLSLQAPAIPSDPDFLKEPPENAALTLPIIGDSRPVLTLLDRLIHIRLAGIAKSADLAILAGIDEEDLTERMETPLIRNDHSYSATERKDLLILKLNNKGQKGLRIPDSGQIPWLENQLKNTDKSSLLLVFSEPWSFPDSLEERLILDWLESYRQRTGGKTYALTPSRDAEFHSSMKNGLRILEAPSTLVEKDMDIFTDINLLTLYMTEDGLKYSVEGIFEKP